MQSTSVQAGIRLSPVCATPKLSDRNSPVNASNPTRLFAADHNLINKKNSAIETLTVFVYERHRAAINLRQIARLSPLSLICALFDSGPPTPQC